MRMEKRDISMYADIIDRPYVKSGKRPQMSLHDRAAQFAPFAALTGHDAAIKATAEEASESVLEDEKGVSEEEILVKYYTLDR